MARTTSARFGHGSAPPPAPATPKAEMSARGLEVLLEMRTKGG